MEYEGQAFCAEDYAMLFASRCASCLQPLVQDYLSALGKNYHPDCFRCSVTYSNKARGCSKVLPKTGFYHQDDQPYCEYHFYELSENVCAECNEIILGRCILAFGKKFHTAHFQCKFCQKQLDQTGYKEKNKKPYCTGCFVKLFS
jgi:paxillin